MGRAQRERGRFSRRGAEAQRGVRDAWVAFVLELVLLLVLDSMGAR
jgi:hypothetical protein